MQRTTTAKTTTTTSTNNNDGCSSSSSRGRSRSCKLNVSSVYQKLNNRSVNYIFSLLIGIGIYYYHSFSPSDEYVTIDSLNKYYNTDTDKTKNNKSGIVFEQMTTTTMTENNDENVLVDTDTNRNTSNKSGIMFEQMTTTTTTMAKDNDENENFLVVEDEQDGQLKTGTKRVKEAEMEVNNYIKRQIYKNNNNSNSNSNSNSSSNNNGDKTKTRKMIVFVHFHKAGGTSMVHKFKYEGGYRNWIPSQNGNVKGRYANMNAQFWQRNRTQFEHFIQYSQGKEMKQLQTTQMKLRRNENEYNSMIGSPTVEFIAMERNFFTHEHFYQPTNYFKKGISIPATSAKLDENNVIGDDDSVFIDINFELVTIIRDPYERFISNCFFESKCDDPKKWSERNILWPKKGDETKNNIRGRHTNKPNFYVSFMNGYNQNDQTYTTTHNNNNKMNVNDNNNFSFHYFANKLNDTHLDIAKHRLKEMIDTIVILEKPTTYEHLSKYFEFSMMENNNSNNNNTKVSSSSSSSSSPVIVSSNTKTNTDTNTGNLPHKNTAPKNQEEKKKQKAKLMYPREEFYKYNALDKEFYEYAIELSLSRLSKSIGNEEGGRQLTKRNNIQ